MDSIIVAKSTKYHYEHIEQLPLLKEFQSVYHPEPVKNSSKMSRLPNSFSQVYREMIEKRANQMSLEDKGIGEASRESTAIEIKECLEHLKKLDLERALEVVRNLGSSIHDVRRTGPLLS